MNNAHRDYWKWSVLKAVRGGSHSAGELSKQFDMTAALGYLIKNKYVNIYGASYNEARLTLTQRGLDYLNELDAIK